MVLRHSKDIYIYIEGSLPVQFKISSFPDSIVYTKEIILLWVGDKIRRTRVPE